MSNSPKQFPLKLAMIFFLVLGFLILDQEDVFSQKGDSTKCWDAHNKLSWLDFKGKIDKKSMFAAVCPSEIVVYPVSKNDSTREYKVKVIFKRYEAWAKNTTQYTLAHEQLHFDITELYARKVRKVIREKYKGRYNDEFGSIIKGLIAELDQSEEDYDKETIHGAFIEGQQKWAKKIFAELDTLKGYASTLKDCN